jgi:glycosyltransferase involved in cell wall biosynthesis
VRAFLVNSGILGHRSVGRVIGDALASRTDVTTVGIDLARPLSVPDRVFRRLMCWGGTGSANRVDAWTLARWRRELHAGLLAARRIRAAERRYGRPDVVHYHTQATAFASVRRMQRTPSIVSLDITQPLAALEVPPGTGRWQYAACAARDRTIFRAAGAIVSVSRWAADSLAQEVPECTDRIHVMPYPMPLDGFSADWIDARWVRAEAGAPVRVLFLGGDFPRKGGADLLAAWRAGEFGTSAELHIGTDWPIPPRDVPPNTVLHRGIRAYTPEWSALWSAADVFVLPTTGEAFGVVFQEAAAAGIPSVGTNLNAVPEIVIAGETGMLIPVHDVRALTAALRQLIADADLRRRMGIAARARAARVYAPADYGARLAGLMDTVVYSRFGSPT